MMSLMSSCGRTSTSSSSFARYSTDGEKTTTVERAGGLVAKAALRRKVFDMDRAETGVYRRWHIKHRWSAGCQRRREVSRGSMDTTSCREVETLVLPKQRQTS